MKSAMGDNNEHIASSQGPQSSDILTVIRTVRVLHRDRHAVIPLAPFVEVVVLEVEPGLREAVQVRDVVDRVDDVERVDTRCVDVCRGRRSGGEVDRVVEDEAGAGLRGHGALATPERDRVVASGRGRGGRAIAVPALGRGRGVLRVREGLEALRWEFPGDGENKVLQMIHQYESTS